MFVKHYHSSHGLVDDVKIPRKKWCTIVVWHTIAKVSYFCASTGSPRPAAATTAVRERNFGRHCSRLTPIFSELTENSGRHEIARFREQCWLSRKTFNQFVKVSVNQLILGKKLDLGLPPPTHVESCERNCRQHWVEIPYFIIFSCLWKTLAAHL